MVYVSESFESTPVITSANLAWQGIRVEQYRLGKITLPAHHHAHHLLLLYEVAKSMVVRHKRDDWVQEHLFRTDDLGLYPGGDYGPVACSTPSDNIYLTIDHQHLEAMAHQGLDLIRFNLRERFHFNDPLLTQLGRQLLAAVGSQHGLGLLYVESLTNALCHQLIEHHATYERRIHRSHSLTGLVLARIDAYLETHADTSVTLQTLAEVANLSVFHFARLFKQATGVTPYQHVLSWKIRHARQLLRADSMSVADISDALGFATPATFSAAFRRATGQSPLDFRRG